MRVRDKEPTVPLSNFVNLHHGNTDGAKNLEQTFLTWLVPPAQYFPAATNKYVAKNYLEKQSEAPLAGALGAYFDVSLSKAYIFGYPNLESDANERRQMFETFLKLYGTLPTDKASNSVIFLFFKAAFYEFTQEGSCANRACYAALQLFKILQDTSLTVTLQSSPSVDHFTVLIGNKEIGYYVYDPLTNPLLVFKREFYVANILSTFRKVKEPADAVNMNITKEISETYDKHFPVIKEEFIQLMRSAEQNPRELLKDPIYAATLEKNKIKNKHMLSYAEGAIKAGRELVEKSVLKPAKLV